MEFIDLKPEILGFRIDGKITKADVEECGKRARAIEQEHDGIDLYVEIVEFEGYEARSFFRELKTSFKEKDDFDNVAIVSQQSWLERYGEVVSRVGLMANKTFETGEEEEAREWIISKSENKGDKPVEPGI